MSGRTHEQLAPRHVAVLQAYAEGLTTEQVAGRLGYKVKTVWDLSGQARQVLGAATTVQAVVQALELGLIRSEHGQGSRLAHARALLAEATALMAPS